ncbi:MAG: cbb3-type cytochrome c oxidase N-terminal domain-containing protein [Bacteroidota bacterium]|nr:cbb3-type cytochrome c oxidase N-terminal domain-containing protein [Bacteroidota bacterium]
MKKIISTILSLIFVALPLAAQVPVTKTDPETELAMIFTISFIVFVIATLMYIIGVMDANIDPIANLYFRVKNYIIPPPSEAAADVGHIYDDIRELDNRIPPWFNYLFGLTVVFAFVYMTDYHVLGISKLSTDEYLEEVVAANLQKKIMLASGGSINENALVALKDVESLKEGGENFQKFCISCHGPQAGGLVGPNLTDEFWIHGGGIKNVYTTIKKGVPAKGMISWELVFSQKQIQNIGSYVLSLQGTNPLGGKSPEGQKYVEPVVALAKDSVKVKTL